MVASGQRQVHRDLEDKFKLSVLSWGSRMPILKVNLLHRQGGVLNAPGRRTGCESNSQVSMGRERLERALVWRLT